MNKPFFHLFGLIKDSFRCATREENLIVFGMNEYEF